jgi:cytochrome c biogenesis protein
MSQVLTPAAPPENGDALDDLDGGLAVSPSDVLERLWRFFISMRTGLVLILGLGLLSLAGTLLEQAPAGMRGDKQAYASWLTQMRPKYGGWTSVLDRLGLFHVFTSIWFYGIVILLATSILACSVNRAPKLWTRAVHPQHRMSESFFSHAALRATLSSPTDPTTAVDGLRAALTAQHYRTEVEPETGGTTYVYADRHRWAPFGTVVTHLSFVLILLGFVLSATTGFKDTQVAVPVGTKVAVGHGTGLTVEATSFTDTYYPDGSPKDYASDLVLYKGGKAVDSQTIRVNHPMSWGGVSFYQSFFGVAAAMTAKDSTGKTVYDGGVPMQWQSSDGKHSIGRFEVPSSGLTVYVVMAASGQVDPDIKAGQVQLEIYRDTAKAPVATEVISQGKPTEVAGATFTFDRTRQFTGLIVKRDPGTVFVWIGSALMVVGIYLVLFFPHRRLWLRVRRTSAGSEIGCAAARRESAHRDTQFESTFRSLVDDLQLAVTPAKRTRK